MSDFNVFPVGEHVSLETHDRICKELHKIIRDLIVENEKLRYELTQLKKDQK